MKNGSWILCALLSMAGAARVFSQSDPPVVVESGPHHRVVESTVLERDEAGQAVPVTSTWTETATGLNYWDDASGQWVESQARFIEHEEAFVAAEGQHKLILSKNINAPSSVDLLMPDGKRLLSNPMGLSYYNPKTGQNVLLGEVKDTVGELVAPNIVVYYDAFTEVRAAIRYEYTRTGMAQDIILLEDGGFGSPRDHGISEEAGTLLEMYSEFHSPPEPEKIPRETDRALVDETLEFGTMRIGKGVAFVLDVEEEAAETVEVSKSWGAWDQRTFLVESVPYETIRPMLDKAGVSGQAARTDRETVEDRKGLVAKLKPREKEVEVAGLEPRGRMTGKGVVLDYTTINSSQTNYWFGGSSTYFISGNVSLFGTNTVFEGGTVLKYTNNVTLTVNTPITWGGSAYRPVVLTARDDRSVGEFINPSNNLSGYYAATALYFDSAVASNVATLQNLRVTHAHTALAVSGGSGHEIRHAQLVNCAKGLSMTNAQFSLRNALMTGVLTNFAGTNSIGRVEHLTVNVADWLNNSLGTNLVLTNCLLVEVANTGTYHGDFNRSYGSGTGVFEAAGQGHHYLAAGSTNRNAGSTNISLGLSGALKKLTTYAPVELTAHFTTSTTLAPQAQRDTDVPDIGYHYDPLDYVWSERNLTNATLALTNGVAVGFHGRRGLTFRAGGKLYSEAGPWNLNRMVRYNAVQEQPVIWGSATVLGFMELQAYSGVEVDLRFTEVSAMADSTSRRYLLENTITHPISPYGISHSRLRGVYQDGGSCGVAGQVVGWTNNVFEQCYLSWNWTGGGSYSNTTLRLSNNLFYKGTCLFTVGSSVPLWTVRDNLFNSDTLTKSGAAGITNSHNGYASGLTSLGGASSLTNLAMNFEAGPLGPFYYPASGGGGTLASLIDAGSRNATNAGLYHFTVRADSVKEEDTTVDIGHHYVAVEPDAEGLVGHWRMDEGAGDTTVDASGYGHHGTLQNGPAWTSGQVGPGALSFDGSNDTVTNIESAALRIPGDLTFSLWMKKTAELPGYGLVAGKANLWQRNYSILEEHGGSRILFQQYNGFTDWGHNLFSTTTVSTGVWHHVAGVVKGNTNYLYVNGGLEAFTARNGSAPISSDPLQFGSAGWTAAFPGVVDDVRVYNRALLPGEIGALAHGFTWDADGDGLPDYFEDRNGDGNGGNDPTSWESYDSFNGLTGSPGLQVFTPLE